jgi:MFS family permease
LIRRADAADPGARRRTTFLLIATSSAVFLGAADQTAIATVLPPILSDTGVTVDDFYRSSWVVNAYLLGYLVALPVHGRIADVYGRGHVFVATLAIFVAGSVLVALAPGFWWLVAARAVQAVGGGGVVPVAMAIVVDELPAARRALGLGAIAAATEAGALIGPLWGGVIAEWLGWRWVFWANLPLALPLVFVGARLLRNVRNDARIDWLGGALLTAGLTLLTFALVDDPIEPRPASATAALLVASAVLIVAFVRHEANSPASIVRLGVFRARAVWAAHAATMLVGGGLIIALIGIPLFVNIVLMQSPLEGGLALLRLTVALPVGALLGGWLAGRFSIPATAILGSLLAAAGFAGLQAWDRTLEEPLRTLAPLLAGFGFGLTIAPLNDAVLQRVAAAERATAAAWLTMARLIGMLVGASLLTSQGLGRFYARAGSIEFGTAEFEALVQQAQVSTFREVFIAGFVVMLAAALVAALLAERPLKTTEGREGRGPRGLRG